MKNSVKSNIDSIIFDFEKFQKGVEEVLIKKGLDKTLANSTRRLKVQLLSILTEMRNTTIDTTTESQQESINIPKAEEEILKQLTNIDVQNFNKNKDYTEFTESRVAFAHQNKGTGNHRRVRLRLPMEYGDDYESQLSMAKQFFNETIFAIPTETGQINYFMNPGIDLSKYVKVVCSTQRGDDPTQESEDRFERATKKNGYAEWSIFQNTIDEVITSQFTNITDIINDIKVGESQEALNKLRLQQQHSKSQELIEKIQNINSNQQLTPGMQAYNNLLNLIKSLRIKKIVSKSETMVTYIIEADYSDIVASTDGSENLEREFFNRLKSAITIWKVDNSDKWFEAFVNIAEKILKDLARKSTTIIGNK